MLAFFVSPGFLNEEDSERSFRAPLKRSWAEEPSDLVELGAENGLRLGASAKRPSLLSLKPGLSREVLFSPLEKWALPNLWSPRSRSDSIFEGELLKSLVDVLSDLFESKERCRSEDPNLGLEDFESFFLCVGDVVLGVHASGSLWLFDLSRRSKELRSELLLLPSVEKRSRG